METFRNQNNVLPFQKMFSTISKIVLPFLLSQKKVFDDIGKGILDNAWKGYNATLFAYGQTGSGKSYSVIGYGPNKGIVPMFCEELFKGMNEKKDGTAFEVKFSMLEIYNEVARDLLEAKAPGKKSPGLKIRQHPKKGFYGKSVAPII